LCRSLDTSVS